MQHRSRARQRSQPAPPQRYPEATMTAKEKLRKAVKELSEAEAADALEILVRHGETPSATR